MLRKNEDMSAAEDRRNYSSLQHKNYIHLCFRSRQTYMIAKLSQMTVEIGLTLPSKFFALIKI